MSGAPVFHWGLTRALTQGAASARSVLPAHHLCTHGVLTGATGSGKTGALLVIVEEALRSGVPVLMVDVKGDLPNLLLTFPNPTAEQLLPWVEGTGSPADSRSALSGRPRWRRSTARGSKAGASRLRTSRRTWRGAWCA